MGTITRLVPSDAIDPAGRRILWAPWGRPPDVETATVFFTGFAILIDVVTPLLTCTFIPPFIHLVEESKMMMWYGKTTKEWNGKHGTENGTEEAKVGNRVQNDWDVAKPGATEEESDTDLRMEERIACYSQLHANGKRRQKKKKTRLINWQQHLRSIPVDCQSKQKPWPSLKTTCRLWQQEIPCPPEYSRH